MLTRESAVNTAKEFIKKCEEQNIIFRKAIVFGSSAQGTATGNSDIDLLLVSDIFGLNKWDNAKLIARINKKFSNIDAHLYPTEYFLKGDPFLNEIKRTGIEI